MKRGRVKKKNKKNKTRNQDDYVDDDDDENKNNNNKRKFQSKKQWAKEQYENIFLLPIVFHNLKKYDSHVVVKHFQRQYAECQSGEKPDYDEVKVIPQNGERYLQFEIGQLRFSDAYQLLPASVDLLVSLLLRDSKGKFVHTGEHLRTSDLIYQKGYFHTVT